MIDTLHYGSSIMYWQKQINFFRRQCQCSHNSPSVRVGRSQNGHCLEKRDKMNLSGETGSDLLMKMYEFSSVWSCRCKQMVVSVDFRPKSKQMLSCCVFQYVCWVLVLLNRWRWMDLVENFNLLTLALNLVFVCYQFLTFENFNTDIHTLLLWFASWYTQYDNFIGKNYKN